MNGNLFQGKHLHGTRKVYICPLKQLFRNIFDFNNCEDFIVLAFIYCFHLFEPQVGRGINNSIIILPYIFTNYF